MQQQQWWWWWFSVKGGAAEGCTPPRRMATLAIIQRSHPLIYPHSPPAVRIMFPCQHGVTCIYSNPSALSDPPLFPGKYIHSVTKLLRGPPRQIYGAEITYLVSYCVPWNNVCLCGGHQARIRPLWTKPIENSFSPADTLFVTLYIINVSLTNLAFLFEFQDVNKEQIPLSSQLSNGDDNKIALWLFWMCAELTPIYE